MRGLRSGIQVARAAMLTLTAVFTMTMVLTSASPGAAPADEQDHYWYSIPGGDDAAFLGVMVQDVTDKLIKSKGLKVEEGAYVSEVVEDSPAESAGMLAADVIVRYGDRNIYDGDDLIKAVRRSEPEEKVAIEVDRAGTKKTFTVTLDIKEEFTPPPVVVAPGHPFEFDFQRPSQLQGLSLQKLGKQLAEYFETPGKRGVLVTSVKKNSPADSAGFRAGDVITTVNGVAVRDPGDFSEELREAGLSQVPVEVVRKGKVTKLSLKPEKSRKYHDKDGDGDPDWSLFRQRSLPETWFEDFHGADGHDAIERLKNHLSELSDEIRSEVGRLKDSIAREIRNL